eukprot:1155346-Pelagomonas_calceolata.AAC.4
MTTATLRGTLRPPVIMTGTVSGTLKGAAATQPSQCMSCRVGQFYTYTPSKLYFPCQKANVYGVAIWNWPTLIPCSAKRSIEMHAIYGGGRV